MMVDIFNRWLRLESPDQETGHNRWFSLYFVLLNYNRVRFEWESAGEWSAMVGVIVSMLKTSGWKIRINLPLHTSTGKTWVGCCGWHWMRCFKWNAPQPPLLDESKSGATMRLCSLAPRKTGGKKALSSDSSPGLSMHGLCDLGQISPTAPAQGKRMI